MSVCEVERSGFNMIDANGFARVHLNHYVLVPSKAHSILWACILSPLGLLPFIFDGESRPIVISIPSLLLLVFQSLPFGH